MIENEVIVAKSRNVQRRIRRDFLDRDNASWRRRGIRDGVLSSALGWLLLFSYSIAKSMRYFLTSVVLFDLIPDTGGAVLSQESVSRLLHIGMNLADQLGLGRLCWGGDVLVEVAVNDVPEATISRMIEDCLLLAELNIEGRWLVDEGMLLQVQSIRIESVGRQGRKGVGHCHTWVDWSEIRNQDHRISKPGMNLFRKLWRIQNSLPNLCGWVVPVKLCQNQLDS